MKLDRKIVRVPLIAVTALAAVWAAPPAPAQTVPAQSNPQPSLPPPRDPAVETIIDLNPQTPGELLRVAAMLADLGRADLAKTYLEQLAGLNPDEDALADAALAVNRAMLLRLASNEAAQPEASKWVDAALAAAARRARDPQYLQSEINRLADRSRSVQREAMRRILGAHEDAVPALVLALGDESRAELHPLARAALVQIGEQGVGPLVAALASDDSALQRQVVDVLGKIGSREAVLYLLAPAVDGSRSADLREAAQAALHKLAGASQFNQNDAVALLKTEVRRHLTNERPLRADADGRVDVWRWDAAAKAPVRDRLPPDHASAARALRLAEDLWELAPDDIDARQLYLTSLLQDAAYRAGNDAIADGPASAVARAAEFGAAEIEGVLALAIEEGCYRAAAAAAQVLGNIGDRSVLAAIRPQVRPLVQALSEEDRQLRFAAAEAIVKLGPASGFAGSSELLSTLAYFAGSTGEKRAVVAIPNLAMGGQLGAMLTGLGYDVDLATNGRQAYLDAIGSCDCELVLLSSRLDRVPVWVVQQQLRRDRRTANVPIGLVAEEGDLDRMQRLAADDPLSVAFLHPAAPAEMKFHVERLQQRTGRQFVSAENRSQQAGLALAWLKELFTASPRDFDIRPYEMTIAKSLRSPEHSAAAVELLGLIGTHSAQRSLAELANESPQPLAMRQAAADALAKSIGRHGIQLTTDEILHQYERYNASEIEPPETQKLLGRILDAIEGKD